MDKIKVNGGYLVMYDGFFIPWDNESIFFREQFRTGYHTFPFKIPNDPEGVNARLLNFPHVLNVVTDIPRKYVCEIYIGGSFKKRMHLQVINGNRRWYEVICYDVVAYDEVDFSLRSIRSLFSEAYELVPAPEIRIKFQASGIGIGAFSFNLNTIDYDFEWDTDLTTTLTNIRDTINADTENNGCTMDLLPGGEFYIIQNEPGPKCVVRYDSVHATESGTFTIEFVDELQWLQDYNDDLYDALMALVSATADDSPVCFPVIHNPGFYGYAENGTPNLNPDYKGFLNYMSTGEEYLMNFRTGETFEGNFYTFSPQVFLARIMDAIAAATGNTLAGDLLEHPDWKKAHFIQSRSLDCVFTAQYANTDYLTFYGTFSLADFMPEMTVGEFLDGVITRFCCGMDIDDSKKVVSFKLRKTTALKRSYEDLNDLPYLEDPMLRYSDAWTGIKFTATVDDNDLAVTNPDYADQHAAYTIGTDPQEVQFILGIAGKGRVSRPVSDAFYTQVYCPVLDMPGSSLEFGVGIVEFTPRIMIFRGLSADTNGQDYPYSTNDNLVDNVADETLWQLTPEGNYNTFWKEWADWIVNSIPVEARVLFDAKRLYSLKDDEKYRFYDTVMIYQKLRAERLVDNMYLVRIEFLARAAGKGL